MIEKLNQILELIKDIKDENEVLGDILLVNFKNAINTIQAANSDKELDVQEKIDLLTNLLGFDLEELVKTILEKDFVNNQNGDFVNADEADQATIDFIVGSSDINSNNESYDDYEKFLEDNKVKENMEYLKGEI